MCLANIDWSKLQSDVYSIERLDSTPETVATSCVETPTAGPAQSAVRNARENAHERARTPRSAA